MKELVLFSRRYSNRHGCLNSAETVTGKRPFVIGMSVVCIIIGCQLVPKNN